MAVNDAFVVAVRDVSPGDSVTVDGSSAETGAANITELAGQTDATIYREYDPDGDGSYLPSHQIDERVGQWHSQGNDLLVSTREGVRLRVENTGDNSRDFSFTGYEVDN